MHGGPLLTGFQFKERDGSFINVSHLFLDDTLVFFKDSEEQMCYLSWIPLCFEAFLGLKVNLEILGGSGQQTKRQPQEKKTHRFLGSERERWERG